MFHNFDRGFGYDLSSKILESIYPQTMIHKDSRSNKNSIDYRGDIEIFILNEISFNISEKNLKPYSMTFIHRGNKNSKLCNKMTYNNIVKDHIKLKEWFNFNLTVEEKDYMKKEIEEGIKKIKYYESEEYLNKFIEEFNK